MARLTHTWNHSVTNRRSFNFTMNTSTKVKSVVFGVLLIGFYLKPGFMFLLVQIIVVAGMVVGLYQKNTNLFCKSIKSLVGRTVLVSGGTTGMGLEIAKDMAFRGAKVIITCPFEEEGINAKKYLEKCSGNDKIVFKLLDLGSLESVRRLAAEILKTEDRLDLLINNAGIGIPQERLTADGMHVVMQVNYFGTCLLTILLLPLLKKSGEPSEPSRIVNTSSVLHKLGKVDYDNWNKLNYWNKMVLYGNSKLCLVMFTIELSKRLKDNNVVVNVVDPGAVGTGIFKSGGRTFGSLSAFLLTILFKNPWEGAQTALYVCLSDTAGHMSGKYFKNCKVSSPWKVAFNEEISKRMWDETVKLIKLKDDEWIMNKQNHNKAKNGNGVNLNNNGVLA